MNDPPDTGVLTRLIQRIRRPCLNRPGGIPSPRLQHTGGEDHGIDTIQRRFPERGHMGTGRREIYGKRLDTRETGCQSIRVP